MAITQDKTFDTEMLEQWQRAIARIGRGACPCWFDWVRVQAVSETRICTML